jgi:hypothetical protein
MCLQVIRGFRGMGLQAVVNSQSTDRIGSLCFQADAAGSDPGKRGRTRNDTTFVASTSHGKLCLDRVASSICGSHTNNQCLLVLMLHMDAQIINQTAKYVGSRPPYAVDKA